MIVVHHLTKRYGSHLAVNDVSFEIVRGEVVGFLGPNGAGKSTTLRMLSGFLGMTSGRVSIDSFDIEEDPFEAKRRIGYMPEAVPLYPEMRIGEYLAFRAELKRVPRVDRRKRVNAAMEKARVADRAATLIGNLSKGYRQRVGLADALVADPPILILDEPTAGLDPNQIREVRDVIRDLREAHTVLLSTHILSEVEASATRVLVIAKGKLVAEGSPEKLKSLLRSSGLRARVGGNGEDAVVALSGIEGVTVAKLSTGTRSDETTLAITWSSRVADVNEAAERVAATLIERGVKLRSMVPIESSLEEVFAQLTTSRSEESV